MSVREQERREKRALRQADQAERRIVAKQRQADKKADAVINRIERGNSRLDPGESFDNPELSSPGQSKEATEKTSSSRNQQDDDQQRSES